MARISGLLSAFENLRARFDHAFDIGSAGLYCLLPQVEAAGGEP